MRPGKCVRACLVLDCDASVPRDGAGLARPRVRSRN